MSIASFITWRYLRYKQKDRNISFMIKICFMGTFIGTLALMLTLIFTSGFEKVIHEKMQGINAQVVVSSFGNKLDYQPMRESFLEHYGHCLKGVSGSSLRQAILQKDDCQSVMVIKAIDAENESLVTNLVKKITLPAGISLGAIPFVSLFQQNSIVIGYKMALQFNINVGDTLALMIPEAGGNKKILLAEHEFVVSGIFNIGLEEYDNNFAFIGLPLFYELYEEQGIDSLTLTLDEVKFVNTLSWTQRMRLWWKSFFYDDYLEQTVIKDMQQAYPHVEVQSWKALYPALVSSLKLEKYVMFLVILLISLVASMNMISLLFMQIQQKKHDIAILQSMGARSGMLRTIFLYLGLTVTAVASLLGLGCAALIGWVIERYHLVQLPDVYYVSYLPVHMSISMFIIVFCVTMLIGFLATWYPAQQSRYITMTTVLRQG